MSTAARSAIDLAEFQKTPSRRPDAYSPATMAFSSATRWAWARPG